MDKTIWIDYLRKEELLHELKYFNISTDVKATRDVLRRQYRSLCGLFRRGSIKPEDYATPVSAEEVRLCLEPIEELCLLHRDLTEGDSSTLKRILARSQYYLMRISRVKDKSPELIELKNKLVTLITSLEDGSDEEEMQSTHDPSSENESAEKTQLVVVKDRPINLCSLNLKYDGTTCVRSFIERLEELRQARGISADRALIAFTDLLDKSALHWFRSYKQTFTSYKHVLARLREDFDIPDLDYRLTQEIRSRTQAKQETIIIYLSIMQGMFNRLSRPLSNEEQLEILMHNIRPEYMKEMALLDINSIKDLLLYGKKLELARARSEQFVEPNLSKAKLSQDFQPTKKTDHKPRSDRSGEPVAVVDAPSTSEAKGKKCFRCNSTNHFTSKCKTSKELVCFKCGEKGFKRINCPKCSKN